MLKIFVRKISERFGVWNPFLATYDEKENLHDALKHALNDLNSLPMNFLPCSIIYDGRFYKTRNKFQ